MTKQLLGPSGVSIRYVALALAALLAACGGDGDGGVKFTTLNYPGAASGGSTLLTGIRGVAGSSDVYISAFYAPPGSGDVGLIYQGPLDGGGQWNTLNYPSSPGITVTSTALYGPDNDGPGRVLVVGNYVTAERGSSTPIGLLYQGPTDGSGSWKTIGPLESAKTIPHSSMGGLVVGNFDTDVVANTGKAFVYDIAGDSYSILVKPDALTISAYGIWYNGGTSYTITGGFADARGSFGYLVDWDSTTRTASNWTAYRGPGQEGSTNLVTHFEGITGDGAGGYNLVSDELFAEDGTGIGGAAFVNVPRTASGTFGDAVWTPISYPGSTVTSANSVYENSLIGIYQTGTGVSSGYVATLP